MEEDKKCLFCGKKATKLCDFPLGYPPLMFDLPEEEKIFDYMGRNITNEILITCSRAICNECAIEYKDLDFCPHCVKKMKKIFESDIAKKSMQRNILKKQRRKENDKIIRTRKR